MAVYLVTGGCGFIGSHLADALLGLGHAVRILDDMSTGKAGNKPRRAELVVADVADAAAVRGAMRGVDGCFHLAAVASVERSNRDWLGAHRANLTGTVAVLDAARGANAAGPVPVVYASSAAVYGDSPQNPLSEDAAARPLSAYGADKLGCEQHAFVAGRVHGVPTFGLRFFNVYGPRQDPASPYSGVISIFCDRLSAGRGITVFGDGAQTRDFVFVGDVVRALLSAAGRASTDGPVCNVCTGRATSIRDLGAAIGGILGVAAEPDSGPPRSGEIRHSVGDPAAARRELGIRSWTELRAGLAETLRAVAAERPGRRDPLRGAGDLRSGAA